MHTATGLKDNTMNEHHEQGQFVICGGADQHWLGTYAKTVRGAKSIASQTYQQAVGGKIEVAQVCGEQYKVVAVKYGYDNWRNAA